MIISHPTAALRPPLTREPPQCLACTLCSRRALARSPSLAARPPSPNRRPLTPANTITIAQSKKLHKGLLASTSARNLAAPSRRASASDLSPTADPRRVQSERATSPLLPSPRPLTSPGCPLTHLHTPSNSYHRQSPPALK